MSDSKKTDSTSLDDLVGRTRPSTYASIKNAILLFLAFIFVVSSIFIDGVLARVPNATQDVVQGDKKITNVGHVVQGVVLVILYAVLTKLSESQIL